jgi:hypothetical protein
MSRELKLLGVHGLDDHRGTAWMDDWTRAVTAGLGDLGRHIDVVAEPLDATQFDFEFTDSGF